MAKKKEVKVIGNIMKKVFSKYKAIKEICEDEFIESTGMIVTTSSEVQFFVGWLMLNFVFPGGKSFPSFIKETMILTKDELIMLNKIENAIVSYFEIISWTKNKVNVKDLLTKKSYSVLVIDLDKQKLKIIRAKLVKTFDDEYFFFGGIQGFNKKIEKEILKMSSEIVKKNN